MVSIFGTKSSKERIRAPGVVLPLLAPTTRAPLPTSHGVHALIRIHIATSASSGRRDRGSRAAPVVLCARGRSLFAALFAGECCARREADSLLSHRARQQPHEQEADHRVSGCYIENRE